MLTGYFDDRQISRLEKALGDKAKNVPREIKIAINAAAKKTKTGISKQIRTELAAPAKSVNKTISITTKATEKSLSSTVQVKKTGRIPLRDFGARQNKRGTSYRISKSKGRSLVAGAFQGPKPGAMKASWRGRVFKRVGKSRLPIVQLWGPSPWGVTTKNQMDKQARKEAKKELRKQIERRIRVRNLKASGAIK